MAGDAYQLYSKQPLLSSTVKKLIVISIAIIAHQELLVNSNTRKPRFMNMLENSFQLIPRNFVCS